VLESYEDQERQTWEQLSKPYTSPTMVLLSTNPQPAAAAVLFHAIAALLESYEDQERLVWEQLSGLVTDAAWLESYAAAAMLKVKEAFQVRLLPCYLLPC
jgi:hypothetical protein